MSAIALLYHDAVADGEYAATGFSGSGADRYKLDIGELELHFDAVAAAIHRAPGDVRSQLEESGDDNPPVYLTFDDGGMSGATLIAPLLRRYGWIGHFFVTAEYVDAPGFMTSEQIKELSDAGHVIGSHSWSHPAWMSKCSRDELLYEWSASIERLGEIVREPVVVASVPGGNFARIVAETASRAGIRALFTSEPVRRTYTVDDCLVLGRFTLRAGMEPAMSGTLAGAGRSRHVAAQYVSWNLKKVVKRFAGDHYMSLRRWVLGVSGRRR